MMQYNIMEHSKLRDTDRDSTKPDDNEGKEQQMYIWNSKFKKWHECLVALQAPCLSVTEFEDLRLEISERQLMHFKQKWFHGSLSRRDARCILQDFGGGNGSFLVRTSESFHGKFAISFVHESKVKHIVIESKQDPVAGVLYSVTPKGPVFSSLYDVIEAAQVKPIIKNNHFDIILDQCPPKPDQSWLHGGVRSLSQVEQILRKEHRDGAFLVYRTQSEHAPYIVAYRSNSNIVHSLVMATQHPRAGYSLNGVSAPVLYKLIHYFMENPINGTTVLRYPVEDRDGKTTNCGIALQDIDGHRSEKRLSISMGALITNIAQISAEMSVGDHRGDRQKYFPTKLVRLLTKEELAYVNELRTHRQIDPLLSSDFLHTVTLNLQMDYQVSFELEDSESTAITVKPANSLIMNSFQSYHLSCPTKEDLEIWYHTLQQAKCQPKQLSSYHGIPSGKKRGCVIC